MTDVVEQAIEFATGAHRRIDQRRKYSWQPYEVHLKAVAEIVASVTDDPEMIAAAWLHDTIEDTPATLGDLERAFGGPVAALVNELTDVSRPDDGNRAARKAIDRRHLARASTRAQTIKLADLIDNARDICKHDSRFGRVFLDEMAALLEVLSEGDAGLRKRARRELEAWRAKLASAPGKPAAERATASVPELDGAFESLNRRMRQFSRVFSAQDIAEPLRSFDDVTSLEHVAVAMSDKGLAVVGVRRRGRVERFLSNDDALPGAGTCGEASREFRRGQVLEAGAPLSDVIHVLTLYDHCFLRALGDVLGVVTRTDIQKPIARMWLFGIVTFVEMSITERIQRLWPDEGWTAMLSRGRLEKARELQQERIRRGQTCVLLDCLQFSDRAQVLMEDAGQRAEFGFTSKASAKRVLKELESLRNNLAHAQDIVTHDWAQIARMARRIESSAGDSGRES